MYLTIDRWHEDADTKIPLYLHYDMQTNPQPAHLIVEEGGVVRVASDGSIGGIPVDVWHGRTNRWRVPHDLTVDGINALIEDVTPLVGEFLDNHSVEWDGSNYIGGLTERGRELDEQIEAVCSRYFESEDLRAAVWDAAEWMEPAWQECVDEYRKAADKDAVVEEWIDNANDDGIVLIELDHAIELIEKEIETD